jgi:DMSO/TMAO reductase YedYZ molybdopterin-dependent catalytic subunit
MADGGLNDRLLGRAGFLGIVGAGVAGLFYGRDVQSLLGRVLPNGVDVLAPTRGWRIYTIGSSMPSIRPAAYRLQIQGLVDRPGDLSLSELRALPRAEQVSDFRCVTGWSVSNVHWAGVRIKDVLAEAAARRDAHAIRFVSAERGYYDSVTLDQALLPDVLLAYEMDGKPLAREHGAPLRLLIPEMYGYKSVKWVTRMELVPKPVPGYWEQHGYDADAWIGGSNGYGVGGFLS